MDAIEIEAMMLRAEGARHMIKNHGLDYWDALEAILMPSEDVLRASMTVATEKGPSYLAKQMADVVAVALPA